MSYNLSLIKFVTFTNCKDDTVVNLYEENQNIPLLKVFTVPKEDTNCSVNTVCLFYI